jgi:hypothetical protein
MPTKARRAVFSDAVIALAVDELRYHKRGDPYSCAVARSHGKNYILARSKSEGRKRGSVFAIDSDGKVWPTQIVDCLYSVVDEPDVYFVDGD